MKKALFLAMAAFVSFAMWSCDGEDAGAILSLDETVNVTVNVDASMWADGAPQGLKVQTLSESVDYSAGCTVKAFKNDKPQIIAVTDSQNKLLMLYRGPVSEGSTITINAQSTCIALVTFNPLLGPIPATDYSALTETIEGSSLYNGYHAAVVDAITRKVDLTSTNNHFLIASLYNLLRVLCEEAFSGLQSIDASAIASNSFFNCFPLVASVNENTLTLRTSSNCPSYYGKVTNGEGAIIKDNLYVGAAKRYGFMDNFSGAAGENSLGNPTDITFTAEGSYTVTLTCDDQSAMLDLYTRLGNNVLAALGASVDPGMITLLSPVIKKAIDQHGIDLTQATISSETLMDLVASLYDGVIEFMNSEENQALTGEANWDLASSLLVKLITVYASIRETTDALLRTSWNIGQEGGADTITLRVSYLNNVIRALDAYDIAIVAGNDQTASSFGTLDTPIKVKVRQFDEAGARSAVGKTVNFVVATGDGTVSQSSVTTNSTGMASTVWTLGGGVSGDVQTLYAVVVEDGVEVTPRVYFNALVSNDRYRCSLCCDWADHTNYASQWDLDFAVASDASGVVPLFNSNGRQWDYNGMAERYEMTGTINTTNNFVDMEVAMYLTDPYYTGGTDIHFRTDEYQFTLQSGGFAAEGNLIYDGFWDGQEWGAGCGTYIWIEKIVGNNAPAAKKATPSKTPQGKLGIAARK
ncbi:MAG: hypothetical protein ACSW8I_00300 [bacterium]